MLIAFKALGATCLAGALATSGVVTSGAFSGEKDPPASATLVSDPHATFEDLAVGGEKVVTADAAGSVTVRRTEVGLEVAAVTPATDWTSETKTLAPDWILVTFAAPGQRTDLALDMVGDRLRIRTASFDVDLPTTTTTEAPTTTTTTEPPTTTTTAPVSAPITSPPPVQPTVIPVAGAGSVVIVLQGPVVVIQKVKVVPGRLASVERDSGDIRVVFRKGDRSFRFSAFMADQRLRSDIRELRHWDGDRDHDGDQDGDGDRDGDRRWDRDGDRDGDRHWDGGWDRRSGRG